MSQSSPIQDCRIVDRSPHCAVSTWVAVGMIALTGWIDLPNRPFTGRIAEPGDVEARLSDSTPPRFGSWTSTELKLDAGQRSAAGIADSVVRSYREADSGEAVVLTVVTGAPADIAVHPPTACYRGIGHVQIGPANSIAIGTPETNRSHRFHFATFRAANDQASRVQIAWAWSDGMLWETPSSPRLTYSGLSTIRKFYVTRALEPTAAASSDSLDPWIVRFLRDFLGATAGTTKSLTARDPLNREVGK